MLAALRDWTPVALGETRGTGTDPQESQSSKTILGPGAVSQNAAEARRLARRALDLARQAAELPAAADLMEQAFNRSPDLRSKYDAKVKLWRCGIATPTQLDI